MKQYYTMKDIAIKCQQLVGDSDQERNGTSESNVSNVFSKCFDNLGLQMEWADKKTGKAYKFTRSERDILVELFQKRKTISECSLDKLVELRALLNTIQGLFADEDTVSRKMDGFVTRVIYKDYRDKLKRVFNDFVDDKFNDGAISTDRNHYLQSRDLEYWVKTVMFELGIFVDQWKCVFEEMEKIQEKKVESENELLFSSNYIELDLFQRIDAQNRMNKDRKFQDLEREYEKATTEEEQARIKAKLEKREAELSTQATDAVIDRCQHPRGYSPSDLLDEARKKVRVPCYKMYCDMRANEIERIKIE